MKIKEVSDLTCIPKRTIHFYVNQGLILPKVNPENNYYDFSQEDCKILIFIKEMRSTGMSISEIKAIIKTPEIANFYMNRHIKKLRNEQRHVEQVIVSMKYIIDELSLFPDFDELSTISSKANIPLTETNIVSESRFDNYNTLFINKMLWGSFLPKTEFSDYQEFLWTKLNRMTFENPSEEYIRIGNFLTSLSNEQLDYFASFQNDSLLYVASLDEQGIQEYAKGLIHNLDSILENPKCCQKWKKNYEDYFRPSTSVQASSLSSLMEELSPFYKDYVKNIHEACEQAYDYLHSEKGKELLDKVNTRLNGFIDLDSYYHCELETLSYIPHFLKVLD